MSFPQNSRVLNEQGNQEDMLTYDEALQLINTTVRELPAENQPLSEILDCTLAEPIKATFDLPRFDNSAMDGFGVKFADLEKIEERKPVKLSVVGVIEAGSKETIEIEAGNAVKIFTGARVPASVDTVVMREVTRENGSSVEILKSTKKGSNIRRKAEEFSSGDDVLDKGTRITPPVIGLLATFGFSEYSVFRKPAVTVVGTGDELVKPGQELKEGQIYDSNSYALAAAIEALGLSRPETMHTSDDEAEVEKILSQAINKSNVVITAGGVSVGDRDLVKSVLENNLGAKTIFWRAAVKPGKPIYFGELQTDGEQKLIFGLPGNPVSALVTFHLFVKPALMKLQGMKMNPEKFFRAFSRKSRKKKPGRLDFVRGRLECDDDGSLNTLPTIGQDSHMLSGLAKANCLIHFEKDSEVLEKGSLVTVQNLNWNEY